jgi:hypothetical protein
MDRVVWIALGAGALVIVAHVALFWFFLGRKDRSSGDASGDSPDGDSRKRPGG